MTAFSLPAPPALCPSITTVMVWLAEVALSWATLVPSSWEVVVTVRVKSEVSPAGGTTCSPVIWAAVKVHTPLPSVPI